MDLKILSNFKNSNFSKNKLFLITFFILVIISELVFLNIKTVSSPDLEQYAAKIITLCSISSFHPACYDKAIPQLMSRMSMEDAFRVTSIIQNKDKSYVYCHVLAHELSAKEVDKNPVAWKDVVSRVPSGMCSNGGIHGAFQERFRGETFTEAELQAIKPDLDDLCEKRSNWSPTGMEQASCYHALGHLTMYITSAEMTKALSLCDELAIKPNRKDYRHLCYDGAFMQIFQPLEGGDFTLIKGKEVKKNELADFCNKFNGEEKGSCWSEGWPLFRTELEKPEGLTNYCGKASSSERNRCYEAIVYVMTAIFNLDSSKILAYCPGLQGDHVGKCFSSAAGRMVEVDYRNIGKASKLCSEAEKYDTKHVCFKKLIQFSTYNYKHGSKEFYDFCNALPSEWKSQCLT